MITFTKEQRWAISEMFRRQEGLQRRLYGGDPKDFVPGDRADYVKTMVVALTDELHEALGEISWKPWAKAEFFNRDAYVSELIDAWHFLMNLLLVAGVTDQEFCDRYHAKLTKNHKRQDDGYDGVSSKCPKCKRDLDDDGVTCTGPFADVDGYCAQLELRY